MVKLNKSKKGAEMPLNTIVIALLVIIVMVVIITFFVSKLGNAGGDIDAQGDTATKCAISNPALAGFYDVVKQESEAIGCGEGWSSVPIPADEGKVCCARKTTKPDGVEGAD